MLLANCVLIIYDSLVCCVGHENKPIVTEKYYIPCDLARNLCRFVFAEGNCGKTAFQFLAK